MIPTWPARAARIAQVILRPWNRYSYAGGDPVNNGDPRGLFYDAAAMGGGEDVPNGLSFVETPGFENDGGPSQPGTFVRTDNGGGDIILDAWNALNEDCQAGLRTALPVGPGTSAVVAAQLRLDALGRAGAQTGVLAGSTVSCVDWSLLAAIGVRETGFINTTEADGAGVGVGIFQITVSPTSGVTAAQAGDIAWAANWAAKLLLSNMTQSRRPTQILTRTSCCRQQLRLITLASAT